MIFAIDGSFWHPALCELPTQPPATPSRYRPASDLQAKTACASSPLPPQHSYRGRFLVGPWMGKQPRRAAGLTRRSQGVRPYWMDSV